MVIKGRTVFVYDIEVFRNAAHVTCKNTETKKYHLFEISSRKDDSDALFRFFRLGKHPKAPLFCGYNNHGYDDIIINYFIELYDAGRKSNIWNDITYMLFKFSKDLIKSREDEEITESFDKYRGNRYFHSFDLMTMLFPSRARVGLKALQITMNYPNVMEFDGSFDNSLPVDRIDEMIQYNINDVDSTEELLERSREEIDIRLFIEKQWGIKCLSMSNVKIAEEYLARECMRIMDIDRKTLNELRSPADTVALDEVILPFVEYEHPKLQNVLEDMRKQVVSTIEKKGYENRFCIRNVVYSAGIGGIHSINDPGIFKPAEDEILYHLDAVSQYPTFLIEWGFAPQHLEGFGQLMQGIKEMRLEAKNSGDVIRDRFFKKVLTTPIGKMSVNSSWMYDPRNVLKIKINCQLVLLMLIDRLLKVNAKIILANTDGVVFLAKKKDSERIEQYVREIEELSRLTFDRGEYKAVYRYSVNDYFAVLPDDSIEKRGIFTTETEVGKGLSPLIIPKSVINYFMTGQSVREYMMSCTDIRDFLMSQRVDRKFKVLYGDEPVQNINRWYASTNGRRLYKAEGDTCSSMMVKSGVTILNRFDDVPIGERHVNYQYYIEEAHKLIRDFTQVQLSLFSDEELD